MAEAQTRVKIWYDSEGDYLEVIFDRKAGYFREPLDIVLQLDISYDITYD